MTRFYIIYYYYYYSLIRAFHISVNRWFFHWSLGDSKYYYYYGRLQEIEWLQVFQVSLQDSYENWSRQFCYLDSLDSASDFQFSNPLSKLLENVPSAPIMTDITVTFMFHSFFYVSFIVQLFVSLLTFFDFHSEVPWNSKFHKTMSPLFFFYLLGLGLVF